MELLYKDLTERLRHCVFDVHNMLGVGYDEESYHQALIRRFTEEGIPFISKERKWVMHRGQQVQRFELDFLTFDKIILLLKCFPGRFLQNNFVQMISELKLWQKPLGLMANVGLPKVFFRRIPFSEKEKDLWEDYSHIKDRMNPCERQLLLDLRTAVLFVYECHGLGYGKTVYQKLMETELSFRKIRFEKNAKINVKYYGEVIRTFEMRFLLVEEKVILGVSALQKQSNFDILKIQTYLRALGLSVGLFVNFGKSRLEIYGVKS